MKVMCNLLILMASCCCFFPWQARAKESIIYQEAAVCAAMMNYVAALLIDTHPDDGDQYYNAGGALTRFSSVDDQGKSSERATEGFVTITRKTGSRDMIISQVNQCIGFIHDHMDAINEYSGKYQIDPDVKFRTDIIPAPNAQMRGAGRGKTDRR